jgi:hypothetical protein
MLPVRRSDLQQKQDLSVAIAEQLEALQSLDLIALRDEWRKLKGSEPPRLSRDLMLRSVAYALQVVAFGELPSNTVKMLGTSHDQSEEVAPNSVSSRASLSAGARLVREWHGRTHSVEVLQEGFLFERRTYRSLSQIARRITGAHWSGPRFFGLVKKRK